MAPSQTLMTRCIRSDITYDPYQTGTYTPLIPCKGVYSRQVIKKKKKYSAEFRNESIYQTYTELGTTYNVRDPHTGIGIVCYEDCLNIIGAHRSYGQESDYIDKAKLTKLFLILRQVKVEKEDEHPWGDIWDLVIQENLESDAVYTGSVTLGPNFNPRPENVEVENIPGHLQNVKTHHETQVDSYMTVDYTTMAEVVKERHPLGQTDGIPPDISAAHETGTATEQPINPLPMTNEKLTDWVRRQGHLDPDDALQLGTLFQDCINTFVRAKYDPQEIPSKHLMNGLLTSFETFLLARNKSEKMFFSVQPNVNPLATKMNGMGYQLVYDHRFRPFIESKLYQSQTLLTYASAGLDPDVMSDIINFDELNTETVGPNQRPIKVFKRHGDIFRTMFRKVNNGKTFNDLIYMTALFIEFYSMKLAESDYVYPSYSYLMEKTASTKWRNPQGVEYLPNFEDKKLSSFLTPAVEEKRRSFETLLTWHALTALILSYVKHDKTDLTGTQSSQLADDFLNSQAIQTAINCEATLVTGAAYFHVYFDSPLLCEYGRIGGLKTDWNQGAGEFYKRKENFIPVQDNFRGGLVIMYAYEDTSIEPDDPNFRDIMRFDGTMFQYWTYLNPTYQTAMQRTLVGRSLVEWNEIFRGHSLSQSFLNTIGQHTFSDVLGNILHSKKIVKVPQGTNIMNVLGVQGPGPKKVMSLQKIVATHDLQQEAYYHNVRDKANSSAFFTWWRDYYNMFSKHAMWSGLFVFANYIAPNRTPWERYDGDRKDYDPVNDYNFKILDHFKWESQTPEGDTVILNPDYYPMSDALSTQTMNIADYITSGGDFSIKGSGMHFINPVLPHEDFAFYNQQSSGFKKIFELCNKYGWNYMGILRPFGKYVWINDTEVDISEYFGRTYFRLGNRIAQCSVPELQD